MNEGIKCNLSRRQGAHTRKKKKKRMSPCCKKWLHGHLPMFTHCLWETAQLWMETTCSWSSFFAVWNGTFLANCCFYGKGFLRLQRPTWEISEVHDCQGDYLPSAKSGSNSKASSSFTPRKANSHPWCPRGLARDWIDQREEELWTFFLDCQG